jgi:predicted O-methyltransferase YrrM
MMENDVLREMLSTGRAVGSDGASVSLESSISLESAEALYGVVVRARARVVLEVGMACGVSSLAILTALRDLGEDGRLISIDPHQSTQWRRCGITAVERAGLGERHRLMEEASQLALPRLLAERTTAQVAYIDGWHTFDCAFLDFWYSDRMLTVGGVIGFNDCRLPAIEKVIRFVLSHRKYQEIQVGLPVKYTGGGNRLQTILPRSIRPSSRQAQDRYFEKREDWEPPWNFFATF